jgi:transposase
MNRGTLPARPNVMRVTHLRKNPLLIERQQLRANLREQGVTHLIAFCHNDACRHQALIDVSKYPGDTPVLWFRSKVKCAKCGARGNRIDVRPNWKEKPSMVSDWRGRPAMPGGEN